MLCWGAVSERGRLGRGVLDAQIFRAVTEHQTKCPTPFRGFQVVLSAECVRFGKVVFTVHQAKRTPWSGELGGSVEMGGESCLQGRSEFDVEVVIDEGDEDIDAILQLAKFGHREETWLAKDRGAAAERRRLW